MHYDNCDIDEGTLFISKARSLFMKEYTVFKVGIHSHLSVSHIGDYRPYLFRPPCSPAATRMSRLSWWFTWSVLNVEAGRNNALEWKSSALFFHLGLSNELFHSERKEEGSRSQKQSGVMFLFSRLMDGPMRRPHRLLNLPEIKTYLFAFSYRVRVWVTDCIHCRHAWTAHSDVISTHKLACP